MSFVILIFALNLSDLIVYESPAILRVFQKSFVKQDFLQFDSIVIPGNNVFSKVG